MRPVRLTVENHQCSPCDCRHHTTNEYQAALKRMTVTEAVKADHVTWVLTVPVCCSEPAKAFMRQAAIKAGFIEGGHDDEVFSACRVQAV